MKEGSAICRRCPTKAGRDPHLLPEADLGPAPPRTFYACRHSSCPEGLEIAEEELRWALGRDYQYDRYPVGDASNLVEAIAFGTDEKPEGRIVGRNGKIYSLAERSGTIYYPTGQPLKPWNIIQPQKAVLIF